MASLTYVCFVPAKGLIRDLSANSSNIAFEVPLASKWWWQSGLISHKDSQLRNMPFTNLKKKCKNLTINNYGWESLCDIRPDCHHHFDASGTSNAMFDELAERSLMSPLAGTKHTYVRLAIIIYCQILALFFKNKNTTTTRKSSH